MSAATRRVRLLVVSDLHAYSGTRVPAPSRAAIASLVGSSHPEPLAQLLELASRELGQIDSLLCAGDLADKADEEGLNYSWQYIHALARACSARHTLATIGNHDVNSRGSGDALEALRYLTPPFPTGIEASSNAYFRQNVAIIDEADCRIVVLNSAADHASDPESVKRGSASLPLRRFLGQNLGSAPSRPANILLCHHHPIPHEELGLGDHDIMRGGQLLMDALEGLSIGPWLVVHGHKHHPRIAYGPGSAHSPVILAAGSATVRIQSEVMSSSANQVHVVELHLESSDSHCLTGTVTSWEWRDSEGWKRPAESRNLPFLAGFGIRESPVGIAKRISLMMPNTGFREWSEMLSSAPDLQFLTPRDFRAVVRVLDEEHAVSVMYENGEPKQIGRRP